MNQQKKSLTVPVIITLSGLTFLLAIFGHFWGISSKVIVVLVVFASMAVFPAVIWLHATDHADGSEWWQDDDSSGWRGY